mmetsp:Transcript_34623/g.32986  ORF Transcript_34623/g.32986 Transcript_34623/m.32986 type:complete len:462 (-) Transcript_34623:358-1743(-)
MASKTAGFVEQDRSNMNCLDILAGVVSNCSHSSNDENPSLLLEVKNENEVAGRLANPPVHRVSCHRCGNLRRKIIVCERPQCPHIFCGRCADKMKSEYGADVFARGCPVCQELCCCVHKSVDCDRKNHCYRKCPASKNTDTVAKVNTNSCENHNHGDNSVNLQNSHNHGDNHNHGENHNHGGNQQNSFHLQGPYHDTGAKSDDLSGFIGFPSGEQNGHGHSMAHHGGQDDHCLSKHGSLDFLAAAVSIIDKNERLNFHQDPQTDVKQEHEAQDGSRKRRRESEGPSSISNGYLNMNKETDVEHYFGSEKLGNVGILHPTDSKQLYFLDQKMLSSQKEKIDSHLTASNGQECLHLPSIPIRQHESCEPKQNALNHQIVPSQKRALHATNNQLDHSQDGQEVASDFQHHIPSNIKEEICSPSNKNHEEPYSIHGTNLKSIAHEFQYPSSVPSVSNIVGNIPPL